LSKHEPFKTQGGLETKNRIDGWSGQTVTISLQRFGDSITQGRATLGLTQDLHGAFRLRKELQREQTQGAAKDL
jgi:hypothetical protein